MTLQEFLSTYGPCTLIRDEYYAPEKYDLEGRKQTRDFYRPHVYGNHVVSIDGYCSQEDPNDAVHSAWFGAIRDREVRWWQTTGGDGFYPVEVVISIKN